jgi:glycosyltransferase involved in cell wall biosynthesis
MYLPTVSDEQLRWLYRNSCGLLALSLEDFGLTPIEAACFGRPTLALRHGGYLETVKEGVTGLFVDSLEPREVRAGLQNLLEHRWDERTLTRHAHSFSESKFAERLRGFVAKLVGPT